MTAIPGEGLQGRKRLRSARGRALKWLAAAIAVLVVLFGAWVVWSLVRPNPQGFAPTAGAAEPLLPEAPAELQFTIDARSRQEWVFFSFATGAGLETTVDAGDWDIAFRRNDILLNGGVTNPTGRGGAIDLGDVPLLDAAAPLEGYVADIEHEERGLENPELHAWYRYDWTTHVVSSKNHTYAVLGADGERIVLLTFVSYYCEDRSPGCITFRYVSGE